MRSFAAASVSLLLAPALSLAVASRPPAPSAAPSRGAAEPPPARDPTVVPESVPVVGRVVDPHGKPVAGATLHLEGGPTPNLSTTDADGRFHFEIPRIVLAEARSIERAESGPIVAAFAVGYGPAWTDDLKVGDPQGVTLQLAADDVPVTGRFVDLEGLPTAGVTIRAIQIDEAPDGGLSAWIAENEAAGDASRAFGFQSLTKHLGEALASKIPTATTGPDGRFRLVGLGRERIVSLLVEGRGVETQVVRVMTRMGSAASIPNRFRRAGGIGPRAVVLHPAEFETALASSRPVEGVVTERASGRPLPGAVVRADVNSLDAYPTDYHLRFDWRGTYVRSTTDAQGRYRLTGLPSRKAVAVRVDSVDDRPLHPITRRFSNTPDAEPKRLDFSLPPAVLVRGRVADRSTGRPVAARVEYIPTLENPNIRTIPDRAEVEARSTDADGRFAVAVLAGPGMLTVTALGDRFLVADLVEKPDARTALSKVYGSFSPSRCHGFAVIEADAQAGEIVRDFELTPSPEAIVTVLDPEGRPLAGARAGGMPPADVAREGWWQSRERAVFSVTGLNMRRIRVVWFQHQARRLVGTLAVRDSEPGPLVVRLQPWGAVSGRLVDADGRPRPGVAMSCRRPSESVVPWAMRPDDATTDADGRFAFEGLATGHEYVLQEPASKAPPPRLGEPFTLDPGEVRPLGDVSK
ncbi:MAG: carboxypeptidase-like regulatory domain-containing protein [Paludisphaera borealis]|uniref:carboxypeptidase-like regulatory domain-containing protein n=1 Tax=Paludisphaera borealis TaxID=1387353 RepID=UPI00283F7E42|nr:carboxypeptidase-like regulatory domain-containing protein [Paludisphaera borealis]MDR3623312.1 carboxypeptidase-like regulatory domain-containing protein [Paludisphaera borealis]